MNGSPAGSSGSATPRLAAFDGLRAVAAVSVLAYHVSLSCGLSRSGALAPVFAQLKDGVTVFFVISGFLLYLPCARALTTGEALPDWRSYMQRRVIRIVPGYWVALTVLAFGPLSSSMMTSNWWRFYGFAQVYNPETIMTGLGVAWSLCVEVSFYALLPMFAIGAAALARRSSSRAPQGVQLILLAAAAGATLILRFALAAAPVAQVPHSGFVLATSLPGFLDWFAAGMALAVLAAGWQSQDGRWRRLLALAQRPGRCWALAAVCLAGAAAAAGGDLFLPLYGLTSHLAVGLAAALLVLPAAAPTASAGVVLRLLEARPARWIGTISYGIYLWHVPLLEQLYGPIAPSGTTGLVTAAGRFAVVLTGAIALGAASWYLVEQPARRLLTRSREPVAAPAHA
jgi:peptidoglycan/LPS O-acetylase OafA/YrhL